MGRGLGAGGVGAGLGGTGSGDGAGGPGVPGPPGAGTGPGSTPLGWNVDVVCMSRRYPPATTKKPGPAGLAPSTGG